LNISKENFYRKFGVSQGRLTESNELQRFPAEAWQLEFINASKLGISFIELLTEREFNKNNPVWSNQGRKEIKDLAKANDCEIYSICVDYIINHSLLNDTNKDTLTHVEEVFSVASELGCSIVVLPLLEKSNIEKNNMNKFKEIFMYLSDKAEDFGITICIESLLNSQDFVKFLDMLGKKNVKAVFDTGNRASFNEELYSEILILDQHIEHVHIKDKNSKGENVILGTGLVNFRDVFAALKKINYIGPLNFETTRGVNPIKTAEFHINLCNFFSNEVK